MKFARRLGSVLALAIATALLAQVPYLGVTTLVMGVDVSNGIIRAAPPSRVRVPPLERVTLVLPDSWTYPIQWRKDNLPIAGATGRTFTIPLAASTDSGAYTVTGAPVPFVATGLNLDVVEEGHFGNFSARLELAAGSGATQIVGFVVSGKTKKWFLTRAVGPSLKAFGVARPVTKPVFFFFDSTGRGIAFAHPAVTINWSVMFTAAGAFPLRETGDTYDYEGLMPGNYTIQVSDASGLGGTVLLEIYELPANAVAAASGPVTITIPPGLTPNPTPITTPITPVPPVPPGPGG